MFARGVFVVAALLFVKIERARAQDYPYQDDSASAVSKDESGLPSEGPDDSPAVKSKSGVTKARPSRRLPSLFRLGIKIGANFNSIQSAAVDAVGNSVGSTSTRGLGGEVLFAMGWDLPYQPVFIEFESGYRGLFMSTPDPLHVIVLGLGLHYRNRIGKTSLWKPGLKTYVEFRIQDTSDAATGAKSSDFSVAPTIALSSLFEFDSFLIEPLFFLNRIQSSRNFFGAAMRVGYRF